MKRNKHKSTDKIFITSMEQAEFVFRTLFLDYTEQTLTDGILSWLAKIKDKPIIHIFLNLPEFLEEYDMEDFLQLQVGLPEITDKQNIRIVGLAACLLYFITTCWNLFGKKIHYEELIDFPPIADFEQEDIEIFEDIFKNISREEFQMELSASIMSIIGSKYHETFMKKLESFDFVPIDINKAKAFEKDPAIKEHMQLMIWAALMRCFIDAVYFYFNSNNAIT